MSILNLLTWKEITSSTSPDTVSRPEALADLARFQQVLEQTYCGYDFFAERGHDWAGTFAQLQAAVQGREIWTPSGLAHLFAEALRFTGDRHFMLFVRRRDGGEAIPVGRHQDPYFADVVVARAEDGRMKLLPTALEILSEGTWFLEACQGDDPNRYLFRTLAPEYGGDVHLLGLLSAEPVQELAVCLRSAEGPEREVRLPLHRGRMAEYQPEDSSAFTFRAEPFPFLQVTTFLLQGSPPQVQRQLEEFTASASWPPVKSSQYVLVDLRGNEGGQDNVWTPWLAALTDEPMRTGLVDRLRSPLVYEGVLNRELLFHVWSGGTKESFAALRAALLQGEGPSWVQEYAVERRQWDHWGLKVMPSTAPSRFTGSLFILYDSGTGSSAESFIEMARQLERAVLLGENSAGMTDFGDCCRYFLPHSRVVVACGHKLIRDERGELHGGIGYLPDYWFDVADPLEVILQHPHLLLPHPSA
jgi:hypothetical protein